MDQISDVCGGEVLRQEVWSRDLLLHAESGIARVSGDDVVEAAMALIACRERERTVLRVVGVRVDQLPRAVVRRSRAPALELKLKLELELAKPCQSNNNELGRTTRVIFLKANLRCT